MTFSPHYDEHLHDSDFSDLTTSIHQNQSPLSAPSPIRLYERYSRIDVVFNDRSGSGTVQSDLDLIEDTLQTVFNKVRVWKTCDYQSPFDTALQAIHDGGTVLIACGGDGTVASVAAAIKHVQSHHFHDNENIRQLEPRQHLNMAINNSSIDVDGRSALPLLLGIIPRGTANALCAALHIPFDTRQALKLIVNGPTRHLDFPNFEFQHAPSLPAPSSKLPSPSSEDLHATPETNASHDMQSGASNDGTVVSNQQDSGRNRLTSMLLLCGIGLEAETILRASSRLKKAIGPAAYAYAGLESIWVQRKFKSTITLHDCVEIDKPFPKSNVQISKMTLDNVRVKGITIANAAPAASVLAQGIGTVKPDDGFLEVTFISNDHPLGLIGIMINLLWSAFIKRNLSLHLTKNIYAVRAKKAIIQCDPPQHVVVDGELVGKVGNEPIEITLNQNKIEDTINVIAPNAQTVRTQKNSFSVYMKRLYRNIRGFTLFAVAIVIAKNSFRPSSNTRFVQKHYDKGDEDDD